MCACVLSSSSFPRLVVVVFVDNMATFVGGDGASSGSTSSSAMRENENQRMEVYSIEDDEELERIRMSIADMGETGEYTGTPKGGKREPNVIK